jgi:hydroxyacylglutathione hydrolase
MNVVTLRAFADNYVYVLHDPDANAAAVVDPGDAAPVLAWLRSSGARLDAILCTHFHRDHTGGNARLARAFPGVEVLAGAADLARTPSATRAVRQGDRLAVAGADCAVLDVPGHTRGHVAFFFPDATGGDLFSGDVLFGLTIGNLFEGTPADMLLALRRLRALPPATRVWAAHEYTRTCTLDALRLDPDNARLAARVRAIEALPPEAPTVPLSLAEESATNPYLRWDDPDLRARLGTSGDEDTFDRLCAIG